MKTKWLAGLALFLLSSLLFSVTSSLKPEIPKIVSFSSATEPSGQEFPAKKPKYDYMSTFLSRNTKPLGLKEDLALKKLLKEPNIKWAIRAGVRHILS